MSSVKRTEMLDPDLPDTDLLFRLFNAQALHIQESRPLTDSCRCSDDKVYSMLKSLSEEQLRDLVDETQNLSVECEFCKRKRIHSLGDILQA
jgi:molecular chaperone Hsp33